MTNFNENLDEVKKAWIEVGKNLGMQIPDYNEYELDNKKTALDRLRNNYKRFFTVSAIFTVISPMIFLNWTRFLDNNFPIYLGIAFSAYFFIAFLMDLWLWYGLGSINPITMSVSEVSEKSLFYRKRHLQFVAILLPIAITLMCVMGYIFSSDKFFIYGIIAGSLLGFIIGIKQLLRFLADYRILSE